MLTEVLVLVLELDEEELLDELDELMELLDEELLLELDEELLDEEEEELLEELLLDDELLLELEEDEDEELLDELELEEDEPASAFSSAAIPPQVSEVAHVADAVVSKASLRY